MRYWVIKGSPRENDWDSMLKPGKKGRWVTGKPSTDWTIGDRIFFWESAPKLKMIAVGEFTKTSCGKDELGRTLFEVRHATGRLQSPLHIEELRLNRSVANASFLKAGPAQTVYPLSEDEAETICDLLASRNPEIAKVWPDVLVNEQSIAQTFDSREACDLDIPETTRVKCYTTRIIRDTAVARKLKRLHNYECQICGDTIPLPNDERYAEAHHIQPLGAPHNGPDIEANILVLCPNHHAWCDYGAMKLDLKSLRHHSRHKVEAKYIRYHNQNIVGTE